MRNYIPVICFLSVSFIAVAFAAEGTKNHDSAETAQAYINLGKRMGKEKKYNKAKKYFLKALEFEPENYRIWALAALAARDNSDFDEAINYYKIVLELEPNELSAYGNIGLIQKKLKKYDSAIWAFNHVLDLDQDDLTAHAQLAEIYFNTKEYDLCLKQIEQFEIALSHKDAGLLSDKIKRKTAHYKRNFIKYRKTINDVNSKN